MRTGVAQNNFDSPATALSEAKAIYVEYLSLIAEYIGVVAPNELWALCGASPPGADPAPDPAPGLDPVFDLFASFLSESIATAAAWVVKYLLFGWLWMRWL